MKLNTLLENNGFSDTDCDIRSQISRLPPLCDTQLCLPAEKELWQEVCQLVEFARTQNVDTDRGSETDIGFSLKQQVMAVSLEKLKSEVFRLVSTMLKRFGVDKRNIIIHLIPEQDYNGFAAYNRFDGSFIIGINSRLLDDFDTKQLAYVVGHECGHVMLKHPKLAQVLTGLVLPENHILQLKYPALSRCQEIVADRIGRLCCGDLATALTTTKQTALQAKVNSLKADLHKQQVYKFFDEEFDGYAPWYQSHPSMVIRVKALIAFEAIATRIDAQAPINNSDLTVINRQCEELTTTMDHDSQKSTKDKQEYGVIVGTIEQQFAPRTGQIDLPRPLTTVKAAVVWLNINASPGRRLRILDYLASKTCGCRNEAEL